jgi:hypothetical protein
MDIRTLLHRPDTGWSRPLPTALDGPRTLVIVFGAAGLHDAPGPLQALRAAFPQAVHAGCSTAGEIFEGEVLDDTAAVAIARFDHTDLRHASVPVTGRDDTSTAAQALAAQLTATNPALLRAVLVFSEGIHVNGSALVQGLTRHLPDGVVITGGLAGDGDRFGRTWTLGAQGPQPGLITAVGLYGPALRVGTASEGGWSDFGPERRITRSEGQVLLELDGRPALDLYKTYLGDLASRLPSAALRFPLLVRETAQGVPVVRTILAVDEARRALVFAGDIPEGGLARLMRGRPQRLLERAGVAVQAAMAGSVPVGSEAGVPVGMPVGMSPGMPALVLSVSCVGRRLLLGQQTEEELETIGHALPAGSGHVGFYSYGEISPVGGCGSRLHNQTLTLTVLVEDVNAA